MSKLTQLSALVLLIGSTATLDAVLDDQDLLRAGMPQKKLTVQLQCVPVEEQNTKETEAPAILTHKTSLDKAQERMEVENQKLKEITAQVEEHRKKEELLKVIAAAEELLAEKKGQNYPNENRIDNTEFDGARHYGYTKNMPEPGPRDLQDDWAYEGQSWARELKRHNKMLKRKDDEERKKKYIDKETLFKILAEEENKSEDGVEVIATDKITTQLDEPFIAPELFKMLAEAQKAAALKAANDQKEKQAKITSIFKEAVFKILAEEENKEAKITSIFKRSGMI